LPLVGEEGVVGLDACGEGGSSQAMDAPALFAQAGGVVVLGGRLDALDLETVRGGPHLRDDARGAGVPFDVPRFGYSARTASVSSSSALGGSSSIQV